MKKKKIYIRPKMDIVNVGSFGLMAGSAHEINDKPYADGKEHHGSDWNDGNGWQNTGWKRAKSPWED